MTQTGSDSVERALTLLLETIFHRGQKIARTALWVEPIKEQRSASEPKKLKQSMNIKDDKFPTDPKQKPKAKAVRGLWSLRKRPLKR